jgi:flagellar motility protein MotE (MotC chaperone)
VIVTRQRRRRSHLGRILLPLAALAALAVALAWPPSQRVIANGPLRPVWVAGGNAGAVLMKPLTFAAQQQTIADRNREIRDLNARLEQQRVAKSDAESRARKLQQQAAAIAAQPLVTAVPAPRPAATAAGALTAGAPGAAAVTAEQRRLAATWAAMDPEKAAAIVQRLPDDQVTTMLGLMDADSAGAIMNALPANVAARISRAVAQVQPATGR